MELGAISGAGASSAYQVKLVKGQQDQEAKVVSTLIEGAAESSPAVTGKGQNLNVIA